MITEIKFLIKLFVQSIQHLFEFLATEIYSHCFNKQCLIYFFTVPSVPGSCLQYVHKDWKGEIKEASTSSKKGVCVCISTSSQQSGNWRIQYPAWSIWGPDWRKHVKGSCEENIRREWLEENMWTFYEYACFHGIRWKIVKILKGIYIAWLVFVDEYLVVEGGVKGFT